MKNYLFILFLLLSPFWAQSQEWYVYDGSVLPNDENLARGFVTSSSDFNPDHNQIIDDPNITGNKILRMANTEESVQFYWRRNFETNPTELTLMFRAKGDPEKALALDVDMDFNGKRVRISILSDNRSRRRNGEGDDYADLGYNASNWNLYRFTMTPTEARLYINEGATPIHTLAPVTTSGRNYFRFGDGDSGANLGSDVDWVIWDVSGAYAPGQGAAIPEGLSQSFTPAEPPSDDATLDTLYASVGTLSPAFNQDVDEYTLELPPNTTSVTFTATPNDEGATVTGAGEFTTIPGTATIVVTAENGTTTKPYTVDVTVIVSIEELREAGMKVFPNPVSHDLNIKGLKQGAMIRIYDNLGAQVFGRQLESRNANIDLSSYHPGIYFLKIEVGGRLYVAKFLKQ